MKSFQTLFFFIILIVLMHTNKIYTYTYTLPRYELALIDTAERDVWLYKQFIDILKTVGFNVTYKSLDAVIDQTTKDLKLSNYNAVFFIFGTEFLGGLNRAYICRKVLELLETYASNTGVLIGLIFPPLRAQPGMNIIGACAPIFNSLGIVTPDDAYAFLSYKPKQSDLHDLYRYIRDMVQSFFYMANIFLATPLETRPKGYHTSLSMPHAGFEFPVDSLAQVVSRAYQPLYLLPINNQASDIIFQTLPYGLYWFNPIRNNHVFISTTTACCFSSIAENFHVCPTDFGLRLEMLKLVQTMLLEVSLLSRAAKPSGVDAIAKRAKNLLAPALPPSIKNIGQKISLQDMVAPQEKIAWMELNVFQDVTSEELEKDVNIEKQRQQQREKLIDYILDSGLNALWITLNPHMYYSQRARLAGKENEVKFLTALSRFTAMLRIGADKKKIQLPALWLGYEITNNIYEPYMPTYYAVDLYENVYQDLPVSTDLSFWQTEIVKPLEIFLKKWKQSSISHDLKIAGVVLDLEMYGRKKTGTYTTSMGFDAQTFKKFAQLQKRSDWESAALRDRVLLLLRAKLTGAYFRYLENEATVIGNYLQRSITQLIPECDMVCYLPQINVSWFYKGFYKGLAKNNKPLKLLTFNTEFFAHEEWFKNLGVPVQHSSVLLLSKLQKKDDFSWIDYVLDHHHGIWLNRFSRFIEPRAKDWTSVEQPKIEEDESNEFMEYLQKK